MKLDTSKDRRAAVRRLFSRAMKTDNEIRIKGEPVNFGDIFGLMAMMEKLTALEDLIATETVLENSLNNMLDVKDESEAAREKFIGIFGGGIRIFLAEILLSKIDSMINFADNDFSNRRVNKYQKEFRENLTALRERYNELYKI